MNTFPARKVPVIVNGIETVAPGQNGDPVIVPVVIDLLDAKTKNRLVPIASDAATL